MTNRVVAVTGATGFVGTHLIRQLARLGWDVRALTRRPQVLESGITWVKGSLEDARSLAELVQGASHCIHVAGAIKGRNRDDFARANIEGTERILAACAGGGVERFLHVSSLAAREPSLSDYAWSKREAEELVRARAGGTWAIVRPPAVYGPGDRETLSLFQAAKFGLAPLPNARARASLIHVGDLAAALAAVLDADESIHGALAEVHDGQPGGYLLADLYKRIGAALGKRVACVPVPALLLRGVGQANAVLAPFLGRVPMVTPGKVRELLHPDWTTADDTLQRLTGWQPAISADAGLLETARWYQAHGWL